MEQQLWGRGPTIDELVVFSFLCEETKQLKVGKREKQIEWLMMMIAVATADFCDKCLLFLLLPSLLGRKVVAVAGRFSANRLMDEPKRREGESLFLLSLSRHLTSSSSSSSTVYFCRDLSSSSSNSSLSSCLCRKHCQRKEGGKAFASLLLLKKYLLLRLSLRINRL